MARFFACSTTASARRLCVSETSFSAAWERSRLDELLTLPSKRSSPFLSRGNCQIKSKLPQLMRRVSLPRREIWRQDGALRLAATQCGALYNSFSGVSGMMTKLPLLAVSLSDFGTSIAFFWGWGVSIFFSFPRLNSFKYLATVGGFTSMPFS